MTPKNAGNLLFLRKKFYFWSSECKEKKNEIEKYEIWAHETWRARQKNVFVVHHLKMCCSLQLMTIISLFFFWLHPLKHIIKRQFYSCSLVFHRCAAVKSYHVRSSISGVLLGIVFIFSLLWILTHEKMITEQNKNERKEHKIINRHISLRARKKFMITIAHPPFFFRLFIRANKLNFSFPVNMKNHLQINSFLFLL